MAFTATQLNSMKEKVRQEVGSILNENNIEEIMLNQDYLNYIGENLNDIEPVSRIESNPDTAYTNITSLCDKVLTSRFSNLKNMQQFDDSIYGQYLKNITSIIKIDKEAILFATEMLKEQDEISEYWYNKLGNFHLRAGNTYRAMFENHCNIKECMIEKGTKSYDEYMDSAIAFQTADNTEFERKSYDNAAKISDIIAGLMRQQPDEYITWTKKGIEPREHAYETKIWNVHIYNYARLADIIAAKCNDVLKATGDEEYLIKEYEYRTRAMEDYLENYMLNKDNETNIKELYNSIARLSYTHKVAYGQGLIEIEDAMKQKERILKIHEMLIEYNPSDNKFRTSYGFELGKMADLHEDKYSRDRNMEDATDQYDLLFSSAMILRDEHKKHAKSELRIAYNLASRMRRMDLDETEKKEWSEKERLAYLWMNEFP